MIIVMEECLDMSTYIRTQWVTHIRVTHLLNMSSVLDQRERETPKVVWQVSGWLQYITVGFERV
jgi:hypothetical protein